MSSHLTLTTTIINKNCVIIGPMFIDEKQTYKSLVKSKERKYTKELSDANARFNREKRAIERVAEEMQKESEK